MAYKNVQQQHAIDEKWFEQFKTLQKELGEVYIALEPLPPRVQAARDAFEASGYSALPDLRPDRIDRLKIESLMPKLAALHTQIEAEEPNKYVKTAYLSATTELFANMELVVAASKGDYKTVNKQNALLYGRPNSEYFATLCQWIRQDAAATQNSGNEALDAFAASVLECVPGLSGTAQLAPDETTFKAVRQLHRQLGGYYDFLFGAGGLPVQAYVDQPTGDTVCQTVLSNIGSDFSLAFAENNVWAVAKDKHVVIRPKGYRLDRDEFIGIISHEIGSHVLEAINGSRQPLRLLELGLAGYEKGNEGRAFLREQIVYPSESLFLKQFFWEYIMLLYLSVSLTQGLAGKRYTFPELYQVVYALYRFWRERRLPSGTNNEQFARDEAWYLAVRIFKGTMGEDGAYAKDMVYLEGNIKCWRAAKVDPSIILMGDIGKFDITNPEHLFVLHGLGIL